MTDQQLVSFGNYLLSKERRKSFVKGKDLPPLKERLQQVHHSDIENWKHKQKTK